MLGEILIVEQAVSPENGEDSFAVSGCSQWALLGVTDGCGGLGSKRYEGLQNHTGAYLASRLAAEALLGWVGECPTVPERPEAGKEQLEDLQSEIRQVFDSFARQHCQEETSRIVGSMQRTLPTTLCAAIADGHAGACSFIWAGDSRGYILDDTGLHQYTRDDVRGTPDAFDDLYQDRPLSNLICAGRRPQLHMRRTPLPEKGFLLCMTDGAYKTISSPMELEMLLLDTLMHTSTQKRWQQKLLKTLTGVMQDDVTLLCCPFGFIDHAEAKAYYLPRYEQLKREFITPTRRKRKNRAFVHGCWQSYRTEYDRTEGSGDGEQDWRI